MKMTLQKFAKDPKRLIKKAPIVIIINRDPEYAIIPYVVYKMKYDETPQDLHENTVTHHMDSTPKKHRSRLWRLLFE